MTAESSIKTQLDRIETTEIVLALLREMRKREKAKTLVIERDDFQNILVIFSAAIIISENRPAKDELTPKLSPSDLDFYYKNEALAPKTTGVADAVAQNVMAKITVPTSLPTVFRIDDLEKIPTPYSLVQIINYSKNLESIVTSMMGPMGG